MGVASLAVVRRVVVCGRVEAGGRAGHGGAVAALAVPGTASVAALRERRYP
ncbi:hypothetical protein [Streptomyces sp. NPDC056160]|uniref:hypothetical protein n=1 Tax=Streptomyces sp. NPDC056160 TaxID=3345731 RepID=UPI0035D8D463